MENKSLLILNDELKFRIEKTEKELEERIQS